MKKISHPFRRSHMRRLVGGLCVVGGGAAVAVALVLAEPAVRGDTTDVQLAAEPRDGTASARGTPVTPSPIDASLPSTADVIGAARDAGEGASPTF